MKKYYFSGERSVGRSHSEGILTLIQIIDAFTFYGIDVLLLAVFTCLTVQLLKATLLKKLNKKLITFLPFVLGSLFYAAYAAARNLSLEYLLTNYVDVLEHGISVGAAATLLYVMYEQFVREKSTGLSAVESVIKTLIEGYVPTDNIEKVAKNIAEVLEKDVTGNGAKRAAEILSENSEENVTEHDIQLLAKLIIETLAHISTT